MIPHTHRLWILSGFALLVVVNHWNAPLGAQNPVADLDTPGTGAISATGGSVLVAGNAESGSISEAIFSKHSEHWLSALKAIEARCQPKLLQSGRRHQDTLANYYWAANPELRRHLNALEASHHASDFAAIRGVTLVAGTAGVGKTFIKSGLFADKSIQSSVEKFDIRDWYVDFQSRGLAHQQADIVHDGQVMSQLLKLTLGGRAAFVERLEKLEKPFLIMDSLDEVHPDDYLYLLETVQQLIADQVGAVRHVFVFGRPLVFREYWHQCCSAEPVDGLSCFVLHPPNFVTTGDLNVSSWNYHCWKYKLCYLDEAGRTTDFPLSMYERWCGQGFVRDGQFANLRCEPNQSMIPEVHETIRFWASNYPCVASVLPNLAGNSMVREIVEDSVARGTAYSEKQFKEEFFAKWLERDTLSGDRPSRLKPHELDLYVKLLEAVAVQYADQSISSADGFFEVKPTDQAVVDHYGKPVRVAVERLLNRSGLVNLDAQHPGDARYRFEPMWFHSWLIEKHRERMSKEQEVQPFVTVKNQN